MYNRLPTVWQRKTYQHKLCNIILINDGHATFQKVFCEYFHIEDFEIPKIEMGLKNLAYSQNFNNSPRQTLYDVQYTIYYVIITYYFHLTLSNSVLLLH